MFEEFRELDQVITHLSEEAGAESFSEVEFFAGSDKLSVYELEFSSSLDRARYETIEGEIDRHRDWLSDIGWKCYKMTAKTPDKINVVLHKGDIYKACTDFILSRYKGLVKDESDEERYLVSGWIVYSLDGLEVFRVKKNPDEGANYAYFNWDVWYPFENYVGLTVGQSVKAFVPLLASVGLPTRRNTDGMPLQAVMDADSETHFVPFSNPDIQF